MAKPPWVFFGSFEIFGYCWDFTRLELGKNSFFAEICGNQVCLSVNMTITMGKKTWFVGKSIISRAMFNSYVGIPTAGWVLVNIAADWGPTSDRFPLDRDAPDVTLEETQGVMIQQSNPLRH